MLSSLDVLPVPMSKIIMRAKLARAKADLERAKKVDGISKVDCFPKDSVKK